MELGWTMLDVADVERSVAFYEAAFGFSRRFVHDSGLYAEMKTGPTTLAFAGDDLAETNFEIDYWRTDPDKPPPAFQITLVTDDVTGAFERVLEAGAVELAKPEHKSHGQTVAYIRDSDGVVVEIATPVV